MPQVIFYGLMSLSGHRTTAMQKMRKIWTLGQVCCRYLSRKTKKQHFHRASLALKQPAQMKPSEAAFKATDDVQSPTGRFTKHTPNPWGCGMP